MPRPRVAMRRIKEVLRLKEGLGLSDTAVSRSVRIARSTVKEYLDRAAAAGLNWETVAELSEEELDRRLFAAVDTRQWDRPLPDWEAVEKELRGRGVTLRLLWLEYLTRHPEGYRYTQFCAHFHAWQRHSRPPTMRRQHRAGEALEVDYAGMTLSVIDKGVVGAGFRCLLALLGPDLRRSELDPRSRGLARCPCPRLRLYRRAAAKGGARQPQDPGDTP